MWLNICQGLILVSWLCRLTIAMFRAVMGLKAQEPTGAVGVIVNVMWSALTAVIIWRSGALSTILPAP